MLDEMSSEKLKGSYMDILQFKNEQKRDNLIQVIIYFDLANVWKLY